MALTRRQRQVLDFVQGFIRKRGFSPSYEEIASGMGLSSLGTVHKHLQVLEGKGFVRHARNRSRSLEIADPVAERRRALLARAARQRLPLVGRIIAGRPLEAIEQRESISLSDFTRSKDVYVLQVRGDSMIDEHIVEGDYVLVEKTSDAANGQIVVALLDTGEATLKRLYREKDGIIRLQPANARMEPIRVPEQRIRVQGRVIGVLRKY